MSKRVKRLIIVVSSADPLTFLCQSTIVERERSEKKSFLFYFKEIKKFYFFNAETLSDTH